MNLRSVARRGMESFLRPYGYELKQLKKDHDWDDYEAFLPFETTLAEAARAGLSVADYVDVTHNESGATQATIDQMAAYRVFEGNIESVCEIGPVRAAISRRRFAPAAPSAMRSTKQRATGRTTSSSSTA